MAAVPPPEIVIWEITRKCNFHCEHCIVDASPRGVAGELTADECIKLLDQFKALNIKELYLSGGEPFLRPDLLQIMEYGHKIGIKKFSIASNGSVINEKTLKKLKSYGLDSVQVSLDGVDAAQNAKIRHGPPHAFEKALQAVRLCRKLRIPVFIGMFLHPLNIDSIGEFVALASKEKVSLVRFSGFVPLGRSQEQAVQESMRYSYPQMVDLVNFLAGYNPACTGVSLAFDHAFGPTDRSFRCVAGLKSCYISAEGSVYPCPSFIHPDYCIGSLKEATLAEIWSHKRMRDFHVPSSKLKGHCAECDDLKNCRGGCRGVTYAYTHDIYESFPNCLRRYSRALTGGEEVIPALREASSRREVSAGRKASPGDEAPAITHGVVSVRNSLNQFYEEHARKVEWLLSTHPLSYLLWESTLNCNLNCRHCAVPRENWQKEKEMSTGQVKDVLRKFAEDFSLDKISALAISGGEPLLRRDMIEIIAYAVKLGFKVGLDSNGYLLGKKPELIDELVEAGLWLPCLSIDGGEEHHNFFRGKKCFKEVVKAINYFVDHYPRLKVQTVTVVTQYNVAQLDEIFSMLEQLGVRAARFGTAYRLGRALQDEKNFLSPARISHLLRWIAGKKSAYYERKTPLFIDFSDDGWCGRSGDGLGLEGLCRDNGFLCSAGVTMGTIYYDGMFGACLSIPSPLSVQGSLLERRPRDLWDNEFSPFRDKSWLHKGKCKSCREWKYCRGGGMHQHDEEGNLLECTYMKLKEAHNIAGKGVKGS